MGGRPEVRGKGAGTSTVTVARQAIYNANLQVIGYELLYRHSADNTAVIDDAAAATAQVIIAAVIDIGLNTLVGSHPGFINCPGDILTRPESMPGPAERVVIEVLEDVVADDEVRAGIKCLRDRGHLIALDDFEYGALSHALLDMADIVKIDLQAVDDQELEMYARDLRGSGLRLIAEKVETRGQFERCRDLGFDCFQGWFLQRPEMFSGRRVPVNRLGLLQLLVQLCDPDISVTELASRVSADAGLSVGVLRCINSSFYGLARRVESIEQAIVLLGLDTLRSLCTLVALAGFADRPASLMAQAVIRARMCELLAVAAGHRDRGRYFLTGLLSMSDVMLGVPLVEAMAALPVTPDVTQAVTAQQGVLGEALRCCRQYERGLWPAAVFHQLGRNQISKAYSEAVGWVEHAGGLFR
jgi:EAL and modified HD-GYP domain-containing signal transduction protein